MNRDFLKEMGLEKEAIDKIMAEHGKAVQAAKPSEEYEQIKSANEQLSQQIVELNNSVSEFDEIKSTYEKQNQELTKQVTGYQQKELKSRIAHEYQIPFELAGRLSGNTEEEIKADAESLSRIVSQKQVLPLRTTEPQGIEEHKYSNQARIIEQQIKSE